VSPNYSNIKYGVWMRPDEDKAFSQLEPFLSYGLITHTSAYVDTNMISNPSTMPTNAMLQKMHATEGILGIVQMEQGSACLRLQRVCRAGVELLNPRGTYDLDNVSMIEGRWLTGQEWCIV
jgi:hypothetical protein